MKSKMKKINLIALPVMLFAGLSCTRESVEQPQNLSLTQRTLTAVIDNGVVESASKASVDGSSGSLTWSEGDDIAVHTNTGVFYTATLSRGAGTTSGTFSAEMAGDQNYYAVYPASAADASNYGNTTLNVIFPSFYNISGSMGNYSPIPMIAYNSGNSLQFKHVGGVLRLTLSGVPSGTKRIEVKTDAQMYGTFAVTGFSADNSMEPSVSASRPNISANVITYNLSSALSSAQELTINVPVPTGTYNTLTVCAYNSSGTLLSKGYNDFTRVIGRTEGRKITVDMAAGTYLFNGYRIAPGNLYYTGSAFAVANSWKETSYNSSGISGLTGGSYYFTWIEVASAFASNSVTTSDSNDIDNLKDSSPCYSGTGWKIPFDYSDQSSANGMTWSEILGIQGSRTGATVNSSPGMLFARVQLTGISSYAASATPYGVLLFPDISATITGKALTEGSYINTSGRTSSLSATTTGMTESELDSYISQGCVFLPAAGYADSSGSWDNGGSGGYCKCGRFTSQLQRYFFCKYYHNIRFKSVRRHSCG